VCSQTLLADRFGLALRRETKTLDEYVMTVAGGKPKMIGATGQGTPGCQPVPSSSPSPGGVQNVTLTCHNMTMPAFARFLRAIAGTIYLNSPVIDMTGLQGGW